MTWSRKRIVRITAIAFVMLGVGLLANSALSTGATSTDIRATNSSVPFGTSINLEPRINSTDVPTQPIPDDAQITVMGTQGFFVSDENAELTAITRNGTIVYHNATYKVYFDVDPVTGTRWTVEYVASKQLRGDECSSFTSEWCTLNVIERVNLSTGGVDRLFAEKTAKVTATRWHDADRINETHVALADMYRDSIRLINVSSDETTWEWNATQIYHYEGDERPQDWTHLNDIEVLDDGTLMVSMRNMDEVVFVRPGDGYLAKRTLGEDGDHSVLFEQHNPDYIPNASGGPAVVVGDSENNRVVEYQRVDGDWQRTWQWRDARMQWPRDADRLPNGRTLVVDTHGDRVMELTPNGSIAWTVFVGMPYDVERLGTGDESTGGPAMRTVTDATGEGIHNSGSVGRLMIALKDRLPAVWINSLLYVGPAWFRFHNLVTTALVLGLVVIWGVAEYRWASWSVIGLGRSVWKRRPQR